MVWIGSAGEAALVEDGPLPGKKWFGRFSILQLAAVMERAALWFGNDSGPMHLAAAVGCPTVSLWGPTEPGKWAPRGAKHRYLRRMERCEGCEYWNPAKICFLETHACMKSISVEDAMAAVGTALETGILPNLVSRSSSFRGGMSPPRGCGSQPRGTK